MSMIEERIKALIMQYDDLIRYRKKLLDCNLAETLLSVIPICVKNQDKLEVHLNEKIDECKRIKKRLKTARYKVSKLYAKYKENTQVKEFLDFAIFLSTVGDPNEEIIALSNSEDRDLQLHNTSLKNYFTDELINDDKLELESPNLLTEEETLDDDDVFTLISKLDAEKIQREYFENERDKLDYLADKLCCLLNKYQRRVCLLDERNETNRTNAQTLSRPLKTDEDLQIHDKIHSSVEYDYESSLSSPANFPNDDISSPEKNDCDVLLLKKNEHGPAETGETSDLSVGSILQNFEPVQSSNFLTHVSESPSPIVPTQSPLKTNDIFDIEFIDVNLSVDDCESTVEKSETVDELKTTVQKTISFQPLKVCKNPVSLREPGKYIQIPTSPAAEFSNSTKKSHQSTFECDTCGMHFLKKKSIILHMREHLKKIPLFHCEKCDKSFPKKNSKKMLVKCPICDVHDNDRKLLIVALEGEKNSKSEKNDNFSGNYRCGISGLCCNICGRQYSNVYNLKAHIHQIHGGEKPHKCTKCGKRFNNKSNFNRHSYVHRSEKIFKCSVCNESFNNPNNRKRHEQIVHERNANFQCAHCDKRIGQKNDLISHIHTRHFSIIEKQFNSVLEKQFKCTECDKSFTLKSGLKRHKLVHSSMKSFECSICNRHFKHHRDRMKHEQDFHGKNIRFRCKHCDKGYWHEAFLIRHLRKDHEE